MVGRVVLVPRNSFMLLLVITSRSTGCPFLHKLLQLPLLDELFFLLLQVSTIFSVMVVVFVETAIFLLVTHIR